jgi:methylated-DNA-[protein]-cysteine S-methyltransferase
VRKYLRKYPSEIGELFLVSDEKSLLSISFERPDSNDYIIEDTPALRAAERWLEEYFSGGMPDICSVPFRMEGTPFEEEVWSILLTIGYGKTMTYGDIAAVIAERRGMKRMSAQAVGGAVGRNRLPVLIPCHRVLGKSGRITGYSGGIEKKIKLLEIENIRWRW